MKPWPEKPAPKDMIDITLMDAIQRWANAEALSAAWEQRCRVAVARLNELTGHYDCEDCWYSCATLTCDDRRRGSECDCGAQKTIEVLSLLDLPKEE